MNIKKIIKEEMDDFDWVRNIEVDTDLTPAQLYNRINDLPHGIVGPYVEKEFADIKYENGRYYLMMDDFCDFKEWFNGSKVVDKDGKPSFRYKILIN